MYASFLIASCSSIRYTKSIDGQPLSKYYKFSNSVIENVQNVDTNFVYIIGQDLVRTYENGKTERLLLYKYLRFDSKGRAFYSNGTKEPITQSNISYIQGQHCFFKVSNNELLLEIYDGHVKRFYIWKARINEDKIHFYKLRSGFDEGKLDMLFVKTKIVAPSLTWPE